MRQKVLEVDCLLEEMTGEAKGIGRVVILAFDHDSAEEFSCGLQVAVRQHLHFRSECSAAGFRYVLLPELI